MNARVKIVSILSIAILFTQLLASCGRQGAPPAPGVLEPDSPAHSQSDSQLEISVPAQFSYQVTSDPDSRRQDIALSFADENGNPVPGLEVAYNQVDMDFFFDSSNCPQCAWTEIENNQYQWNIKQKPNARELIHEYLEVGFNAEVGYFGIWWNQAEPENNQWNSFFCQFSEGEYPCTGAVQGEIWQEEPVPNRFFYADLGPDFRFNHARDVWRPEWLDINDEAAFKREFEEYVAEIIRRGDLTVDGYDYYMIGYESAGASDVLPWSNSELHSDEWVDEWIDFFDWEIEMIRKYDPEAIIGLNLHSIGWDSQHMDLPANMAPQPWIEGLIENGSDFDIIGFEIHPGASSCEGDSREFNQQFLDTFKRYGKGIYIWEYGVSSRGSLEVESWCVDWDYSVDSMDEEYQDRIFMDIFDLFFQDPQVVGIRILDYIDKPLHMRDPEDLWTREVDLGLLSQDGTKKPVYHSLKNYWYSQFASGSGITDENGQITFNAVPGIFEVVVAGQTVTAHLHSQDSIFVREKGDMVVYLDGEMAMASPPLPTEGPPSDKVLSPCDLSPDMIGQDVTVLGQVGFVDHGNDGVFFEIQNQGCRVGAFIMESDWDGWSQSVRNRLVTGSTVQARGRIGEFQGQLELQVSEPPLE